MSTNTCNDIIADCDKDSISINGYCIPISQTLGHPEYMFTQQYESGTTNFKTIASSQQSILEGIESCKNNPDCHAIRVDYGITDNKEGYEFTDTDALITMLHILPNNENKLSTNLDDKACASVYLKTYYKDGNPGEYTLTNNNKTKFITFDTSNVKKPSNTVPRILSTYGGATCRQLVSKGSADPSNTDLLNNMKKYCDEHNDLQVCADFCSNNIYSEYCPKNKPTELIIFSTILLIALFIIMYLFSTHSKYGTKLFYSILVLIIIGSGIGLAITAIKYEKPVFNGTAPDVSPSSILDPNLTKKCETQEKGQCFQGCRNIFGECDCTKTFKCAIIPSTTAIPVDVKFNDSMTGAVGRCLESPGCSYMETPVNHESTNCDIINDTLLTCPFQNKKDATNASLDQVLQLCKIPDDRDDYVKSTNYKWSDGCIGTGGHNYTWASLIPSCPDTHQNTCMFGKCGSGAGTTQKCELHPPTNTWDNVSESGVNCDHNFLKCFKYPQIVRSGRCYGDI